MRGKPKREDLFKIPNLLCYIRILLVPVFIICFLKELYYTSALIVILASFTDILDGYIARRFNMITDWGKFIDPVADKLMQISMLLLTLIKIPQVLILVIFFVFKESVMLFIGIYLYKNNTNLNGAIKAGKMNTVVLDLVLLYFIAAPVIYTPVAYILILIVLSFLIFSFYEYMKEYKKLYTNIKSRKKED